MSVTRLQRRVMRRRLGSIAKQKYMKMLLKTPTIKNVDIEKLRVDFLENTNRVQHLDDGGNSKKSTTRVSNSSTGVKRITKDGMKKVNGAKAVKKSE